MSDLKLKSAQEYFLLSLLVAASVLISLVLAEGAYRVYRLLRLQQFEGSFHLASSVYGQYDNRFGQTFIPDTELVVSVIAGTKVVWCGGVVASANRDGLGGRSTIEDAANGDFVIFTTGDSFSHWKRDGETIPDVVEQQLSSRTGLKVVNLNFARGGYGLLQMLTIASEMAKDLRSSLIVIQFISDDLNRGRWWTKEEKVRGRTRYLMSSRPDGFANFEITNDEFVVDSRATDPWCKRQLRSPHADDVEAEAAAFYRSYLRSKDLEFNPWSLKRSYLADRLSFRLLGKPISRQAQNAIIPRVNSREFRADAQYKVAIDKLRALTIPIVLIHIPTGAELRGGSAALTREQEEIWRILEADLKTRIHTIFDRRTSVEIPEKIDLAPWEGHPNHDGIRFYGRYVADLLISQVKR